MGNDTMSPSSTEPKKQTRVPIPNDVGPAIEYEMHYKWGLGAQIVSIVDMALGIVSVMSCCVFAIVMIYVTIKMKNGNLNREIQESFHGLEPENENAYLGKIFAEIFLWAAATCVHIWVANQLRIGTMSRGFKPREILKKCILWRNLAFVFLLMTFGYSVYYYDRIHFWLFVKVRLVCILLVCLHIRELKEESQQLHKTKEKYAETAHQILQEQENV